MMRMKRFSRSSRPTGPKMRVPRGSPSFFKITAAFSSNLMYEPSPRRRCFTVRTTTALTTSPFLTLPPGMASLTVATMTSPMPAYRRPEPPRTRMQRSSLAPVLSATRSRDSCWIMSMTPGCRAGSHPWASLAERSLGLFEDLDDAPPLRRREWTGLHQEHAVAGDGGVLLVVGLELVGPADDLAVQRVLEAVLDGHDDRLVHLVADDEALSDLPEPPVVRHGLFLLGHAAPPAAASTSTTVVMPSSRSRIIV